MQKKLEIAFWIQKVLAISFSRTEDKHFGWIKQKKWLPEKIGKFATEQNVGQCSSTFYAPKNL